MREMGCDAIVCDLDGVLVDSAACVERHWRRWRPSRVRRVEHYRDALGFRTEFAYGEPIFYAGVERDAVIMDLQAANETQRPPGHGAVNIFVTDVDGLDQELKARLAALTTLRRECGPCASI